MLQDLAGITAEQHDDDRYQQPSYAAADGHLGAAAHAAARGGAGVDLHAFVEGHWSAHSQVCVRAIVLSAADTFAYSTDPRIATWRRVHVPRQDPGQLSGAAAASMRPVTADRTTIRYVAVDVALPTVVRTPLGALRGAIEGGVSVWRGCPMRSSPSNSFDSWLPFRWSHGMEVRDAIEHAPLPRKVSRSWVPGGTIPRFAEKSA